MGYSTKTKLGTFYLHHKRGKHGQDLYFFSRKEVGSVEKPSDRVVKVSRTGLPVLAKK